MLSKSNVSPASTVSKRKRDHICAITSIHLLSYGMNVNTLPGRKKTMAENYRNRHSLLARGDSKKQEGLGENTPRKETFTGKRSIAFCSPTNVRTAKISLHSEISPAQGFVKQPKSLVITFSAPNSSTASPLSFLLSLHRQKSSRNVCLLSSTNLASRSAVTSHQ